jgi:hypothetical protein
MNKDQYRNRLTNSTRTEPTHITNKTALVTVPITVLPVQTDPVTTPTPDKATITDLSQNPPDITSITDSTVEMTPEAIKSTMTEHLAETDKRNINHTRQTELTRQADKTITATDNPDRQTNSTNQTVHGHNTGQTVNHLTGTRLRQTTETDHDQQVIIKDTNQARIAVLTTNHGTQSIA